MQNLNNRIILHDDTEQNKYDIDMIGKTVTLMGKKHKISNINVDTDHISLKFKTLTRTYSIEITGIPKAYEMTSMQKMKAQVKIYKRSLFHQHKLMAIEMHRISTN
jgi:hypothetical protein